MDKDTFKNILKEVSLDCVLFGFRNDRLVVLLLKWKGTGKWCLPGGRIFAGESLKAAVSRTVEERTGLKGVFLQQFNTFGEIDRYTHYSQEETMRLIKPSLGDSLHELRAVERTISVGYYALMDTAKVNASPDAYTDEFQWWDINEVPPLLFDHNEMITVALKTLRREIRYQPVGNLLPEKFTLNELHKLFQSILDTPLDRRNFHKLVTGYDFLIKLDEKRTGGANKAPHLYRFDADKYYQALSEGISV